LELIALFRELPGLVEQRPGIRVASPGADETGDGQREDARHRRAARIADDERGRVGRVLPRASVELHPRTGREQEMAPEVEAALGAELEPRLDQALDGLVPAAAW